MKRKRAKQAAKGKAKQAKPKPEPKKEIFTHEVAVTKAKFTLYDVEYTVGLPILQPHKDYPKGEYPFQHDVTDKKIPIKICRARIPFDSEKED